MALSVAAFAGDLILQPQKLRQRGGVVSAAHHMASRASVGASLLLSQSLLSTLSAASLYGRVRVWNHVYSMAEVALWKRAARRDEVLKQRGAAGYARVGWFVLESLDLHLEWGGRAFDDAYAATKLRYLVGASWQALPWVELNPAVLFEEQVETGMSKMVLVQLHLVY
jgi:hypothetical protein